MKYDNEFAKYLYMLKEYNNIISLTAINLLLNVALHY